MSDAGRSRRAHLRHELRTPLNHMVGYSEMILEELPEAARPALAPRLQGIRESAQHLLAGINEFLAPEQADTTPEGFQRLAGALAAPIDEVLAAADQLRGEAREAGQAGIEPDLDRIIQAAHTLRALVAGGLGVVGDPGPAPVAGAPPGPPDAPAFAETGWVLVVDDIAENREMLSRRLARLGYQVCTAASGAEALELLRRQPVDVALLDLMMPGLPGDAVLEAMKADPALRDVPVLMISALDETASVVRCLELGAEDYLPKPFDPVILRARVGACVEKKRLRDREVQHLRELSEWNRTLEQRVAEKVAEVERLGRLRRFFSPQLAELIVAGGAQDPLRTHRRDITVVFLDLRGFTAFAATAEPEDVMGVLHQYHAEMGTLIMQHEGTLERFTGDGMMVFFNDPVLVDNAAERAIRMAVAMRSAVGRLQVDWQRHGYDLDLGVGIASGYATIGAIGFEGRWDYGAIGTVTNLSARLCQEARGGQILVTARLAASVDTLVEVESVGALTLRGLSRPVPTVNVVGLRA